MRADADRLAALEGHYQLHFAGRPRATRDLAMLDAMLAALPSEAARDQQAAWQSERQAIALAQRQLTEQGVALARTMERLGLVPARVGRLAAVCAADDATRAECSGLLADLAQASQEAGALRWPEELAQLLGPEQRRLLAALESSEAHVRAWQAASAAALTRPAAGQRAERTGTGEQAFALDLPGRAVRRAQRLLQRYAAQITGRLQPTVRPGLLTELALGMEQVAVALEPLQPPDVDREAHANNCRALAAQAAHWRAQGAEGLEVRRQRAASELVGLLLEEADAILAAVDEVPAGKDGALATAWLGQRMDEVFRQLDALPTAFGLGSHAQATLGIVDCVHFLDARLAQLRGGER